MGYNKQPNGPTKSNGKKKYNQGKYNLLNKEKYLGNPDVIYFRSQWEYNVYYFLDNNSRVLKWNSEGITIPYEMQENGHWDTKRYYPDIFCKILQSDGKTIKDYVIEIKPFVETQIPKEPKKQTLKSNENYEYRLKMFQKNLIKWQKAKEYCDKRGITFMLLTEEYFKDKSVKLF